MSKSQREKGIILSYVTMAVNFVLGIVFTPFITRMLGTSEYGLYNLASSIIAYLTMLDLGFGNSMIRFSSRYKALGDKDGESRLNGLFLIFFSVISVIAFIFGLGIYFNIESFFTSFTAAETERAKLIFIILLINVCTSFPFTVVSAILSTNERFYYLKLYNLITSLVKYGLEAIVLYMGFKSVAIAVVAAVVSIVAKIFPILYCRKNLDVHFKFTDLDKKLLKEVITYSSFIFINILVDQIYANTDKIILGKVAGTAAVAIYGIAANLDKDFNQFSTSISGVFLPNITKLITKKVPMQQISDIFIRIGRIQFIILTFILGGFVIFGKQFIHFWVGDDYAQAYYITLILMAPKIVSLSQNIGVSILQAKNKHRVRSVVYLFISVLNVAISIPLAIKWGGIGAAVGTLIGNLIGQISFMNWYYHKKIGIDIPRYWKDVFLRIGSVVAIYSVAGWFVMSFINTSSLFTLLVAIAIYSVIFVGVAWFLIFNKEEKKLITDKTNAIKTKFIRKQG